MSDVIREKRRLAAIAGGSAAFMVGGSQLLRHHPVAQGILVVLDLILLGYVGWSLMKLKRSAR